MLDLEGDPGGHPGNPNVEIKPYSEGTTSDVYWRLSIIGGEYTYLIVNNYNGQCVDVYDGGFWSGNNIWAYNCWPTSDTLNSPAQQWYIWQ